MANVNVVLIGGNLTRDPEVRFTPSGACVAQFGLAVNRKWKDKTGQTKEEVTFVDIEAWGKSAEFIRQYFAKGSAMLVQGRLRLQTWVDKQANQKRSKIVVSADRVSFLGGKKPDGQPGQTQRPAAPAQTPGGANVVQDEPGSDELAPPESDMPF